MWHSNTKQVTTPASTYAFELLTEENYSSTSLCESTSGFYLPGSTTNYDKLWASRPSGGSNNDNKYASFLSNPYGFSTDYSPHVCKTWVGFGEHDMPKPGMHRFSVADDWYKIICENVIEVQNVNERHTLSISPTMDFEDTYVVFARILRTNTVSLTSSRIFKSICLKNTSPQFYDRYNESAGGKRFIVRYVPQFERTYEIFQEHEDYVNMSVLVRDCVRVILTQLYSTLLFFFPSTV